MLTIKGFITDNTIADNTSGVTNTLCELTTLAQTSAKEKGIYTLPGYERISLVTFKSVDGTGAHYILDTDDKNAILTIAKTIHQDSLAGSIVNAAEVAANLTTVFSSAAEDFHVGPVVEGTIPGGTTTKMPEWISFKLAGNVAYVRLWFSDPAFRNQYDEYEHVVIPPVDALDAFFGAYGSTVTQLKLRTIPELMTKISAATAGNPYTTLRTVQFNFVNQADTTQKTLTDWTVAVYGNAGDNVDLIKATLIDYILAHSTHLVNDWKLVLPDIFTSTEFIIAPLWDRYSVPNRVIEAGIYSPTVKVLNVHQRLLTVAAYPEAHIKAYGTLSATTYKSLLFMAVGSPENRDGVVDFDVKFADYMAVPTESPDFGRMTTRTQQFVLLLHGLIVTAEEMTGSTDVPLGYNRLKRNNVLYAAATYENVQYLVVAKNQL